ncbi:Uncharacterised protein [uncultured archaeon]|nr:Uncharacterised protein [uncultured archaeon]
MHSAHLIRFYSGEGKPTLLCRHDGEIKNVGLSGSEDVDFSDHIACIGFRTPHNYHSCKNDAIHVRQCPTCAYLDVSRAYTVGNFEGYEELHEQAKKEEYVLYLAGFGERIVKCGVTRKARFEERMREQGADLGCIIASFAGPDKIYDAEQSIQARFSFNNSVRLAQKMRNLDYDRQEARQNFSAAVEMVKFSELLPDFTPKIMDFSQYYPRVKSFEETYSILGKILGAKGEILLFKSDSGKTFAVNMRKKVGTFFDRPV